MKNQELFKEAIADAKAVRNAALAQAKKSLEEAFAPKIQSMLNKKLQEAEDADLKEEELEEAENVDESTEVEESAQVAQKGSMEEELDSLLKELGMDEAEEGEVETPEAEAPVGGGEEAPEGEEFEAPEGGEEDGVEGGLEGEAEEVVDLTVDQLTAIIRSTIQDVMGGGAGVDDLGADLGDGAGIAALGGEEEFAGEIPGGDATLGDEGEEEVNLDELIAELEVDENVDESSTGLEDPNEKVSEAKVNGTLSNKSAKSNSPWHKAKANAGKAPKGGTEAAGGKAKVKLVPGFKVTASDVTKSKSLGETKELEEAIKVIKALRSNLNEVNLLNAKLLYVNKIFKAKSLTESQKVKVVSAFDKATTVREAKAIFGTLSEALSATKKTSIKESFGLASKPVGSTAPKKDVIVESAAVTRMQKLAGIKPLYN